MNSEMFFGIVSNVAVLAWFLLIVFPKSRVTSALVLQPVIPAILSVAYLIFIVSGADAFAQGGGFSTLAAVKILFANNNALLAGWIHYLVFDLLIGTWIVRDAKGIAHWKLVPVLLLTFLFGPIGWLTYQIQKRVL